MRHAILPVVKGSRTKQSRSMTTASMSRPAVSTVYAILFAAAGCHLINDTMQAIMLSSYPLLHDVYKLSFTQVGFMTFAFQVTGSLLQPFIGLTTDKKPWPLILPLAPAFTLLGFLLLALAPNYPLLLAGAVSIGIGSAMFHPDASRVSRLASGGRYGMAQSLFQVGGNIGTALGPLIAAWFILPKGQHMILYFAGLAIVTMMILSLVARWFSDHLSSQQSSAKPIIASPHSTGTIILCMCILVALMLSKFVYTSAMHSFYSFYMMETFSIPAERAQTYLFIFLGAIAVGTFAGGPIGDRIGRKTVIWVSVLGTLPFSIAMLFANEFWTVVLTVPIGLILASAFPAIVVYGQELLPGRVGMVSGIFFGLAFGLGGIGAAAMGALADATSLKTVFWIIAFLPALGALAFFLPSMKKAQQT
jgi:MFS transporter, FSR family, fosmidomycin resistance protein